MGQGVTGRARASRLLIGVCCALAVLLAVMAVMQYRWATLVADGEARRTKAALDTAASLFARDFDRQLAQIYIYLQNGGARAVRQRAPFTGAPPLIRDFYYVEPRETGFWIFQRIGRDGKVSDPTADPDPLPRPSYSTTISTHLKFAPQPSWTIYRRWSPCCLLADAAFRAQPPSAW